MARMLRRRLARVQICADAGDDLPPFWFYDAKRLTGMVFPHTPGMPQAAFEDAPGCSRTCSRTAPSVTSPISR